MRGAQRAAERGAAGLTDDHVLWCAVVCCACGGAGGGQQGEGKRGVDEDEHALNRSRYTVLVHRVFKVAFPRSSTLAHHA